MYFLEEKGPAPINTNIPFLGSCRRRRDREQPVPREQTPG